MDRNAVRQWKRCDCMNSNERATGHIPNFHVLRESIVGGDVGIWLVNYGDEEMLPIRRGTERLVVPRLSDRCNDPCGYIHESQLGSGVVIEDIFVVPAAECIAVFIGAALATFAIR